MTVLRHPFEVDPLIAEAKQRARRRRLLALAAAGLIAAGLLAFELAPSGTGGGARGTNSTIPWLPTKPNIGPAHPPLAPACTASQLRASLGLQGATQSLVGRIVLVNRSSRSCSLLGRPRLSFAGATSKWQETSWPTPVDFDPLAPRRATLRALAPGEHFSTFVQWWNWCGTGAEPGGTRSQPPSAIVLSAPGGGRLRLTNTEGSDATEPVCNGGPGSVSTLSASPFTPFLPQGQRLWLPFRVSVASGPSTPVHRGLGFSGPWFRARAGSRLDFTVVLTNKSRKVFRFGRKCPPYTEDWGPKQAQAYILNCHAVGPIAPGQSVRFAMRANVPKHDGDTLFWDLAPDNAGTPSAPMIEIISPSWRP